MEVKINKEIKNYKSKVFFGLNWRQLGFGLLALGVSIGVYFLLYSKLNKNWVMFLTFAAGLPFAFLGFWTLNGMPGEKILVCIIRNLWIGIHLRFIGTNHYEDYFIQERKRGTLNVSKRKKG